MAANSYIWCLKKEELSLHLEGMMPSKLKIGTEFCSMGKAGPGMKFSNRTE